jgi:hypothetical protein
MAKFESAAPDAAMSIARLPPILSVNGPLNRKAMA